MDLDMLEKSLYEECMVPRLLSARYISQEMNLFHETLIDSILGGPLARKTCWRVHKSTDFVKLPERGGPSDRAILCCHCRTGSSSLLFPDPLNKQVFILSAPEPPVFWYSICRTKNKQPRPPPFFFGLGIREPLDQPDICHMCFK